MYTVKYHKTISRLADKPQTRKFKTLKNARNYERKNTKRFSLIYIVNAKGFVMQGGY